MGILKIEIDLPEFDKEISLGIVIKKDGEVLCNASPHPEKSIEVRKEIIEEIGAKRSNFGEGVDEIRQKTTSPKKSNSSFGGNMMNIDI